MLGESRHKLHCSPRTHTSAWFGQRYSTMQSDDLLTYGAAAPFPCYQSVVLILLPLNRQYLHLLDNSKRSGEAKQLAGSQPVYKKRRVSPTMHADPPRSSSPAHNLL